MKEIEKDLVRQLQELQEEIEYIHSLLLTPIDIEWVEDLQTRAKKVNTANVIPFRIKYKLMNEYNQILAEYRI